MDPSQPARNLVLTDILSPAKDSLAGKELKTMLSRLSHLGYPHDGVFEGVNVMSVQEDMKRFYLDAEMMLVGSPANHDVENNAVDSNLCVSHAQFKTYVFYSLQWACRNTKTIVAMTYSQDACKKLEWWQDKELSENNRAFLLVPAKFDMYRPRTGLKDTLDEVACGQTTMLALSLPVELLSEIKHSSCGKIDGSATLGTFLLRGRTITFGAFIGELEVDIAEAAARLGQRAVSQEASTQMRIRQTSRSRSPRSLSNRMQSCGL